MRTDLDIVSGDSARLELTVIRPDLYVPLDLWGADVYWKLAIDRSSPAAIEKSSLNNGIEIINLLDGRVDVLLSPVETEPLNGDYIHELKVIQNGYVITAVYGHVYIKHNLIEGPL